MTTLDLDSVTTLGNIQVVSYLDEDVEGISDDILVTTASQRRRFPGLTLDGVRRIGFRGWITPKMEQLVNASYAGWAGDQFPELENAIDAGTQTFSVAGEIDFDDLPASADPFFGQQYGPNDVTTAFAWDTDAIQTRPE